jgi:hypothetical protein
VALRRLIGLLFLRTLSDLSGRTQPQRDVGGLHRFPYHAHEIVAQSVEVRLIPELGTEGFQCLGRIVLAPVEAAIYKRLHASSQRYEQAGNGEGRDHDSQLYNVGETTLRVVGFFSSAAVVTIFDDPLAPLNTKVPRGRGASFSGLGGQGRSTFCYWARVAIVPGPSSCCLGCMVVLLRDL